MMDQYDLLNVENEQLAIEINAQRTQIDSLRMAINQGRYDLEKARKEADMLRRIMTGYVVTLDSLRSIDQGSDHKSNLQGGERK